MNRIFFFFLVCALLSCSKPVDPKLAQKIGGINEDLNERFFNNMLAINAEVERNPIDKNKDILSRAQLDYDQLKATYNLADSSQSIKELEEIYNNWLTEFNNRNNQNDKSKFDYRTIELEISIEFVKYDIYVATYNRIIKELENFEQKTNANNL